MAKITIKKSGTNLILFIDAKCIEEQGVVETFCHLNEEFKCTIQLDGKRRYASLEIRREIL